MPHVIPEITATIPAGAVVPFIGTAIPDRYLLCDGSAVSRIEHFKLFAAIDTLYGNGDGSTSFNLPDIRGRFILHTETVADVSNTTDFKTAVDPAYVISAYDVVSHTHGTSTSSSTGNHRHSLIGEDPHLETTFSQFRVRGFAAGTASANTSTGGDHTHSGSTYSSGSGHSHPVEVNGGDAETRPRNVAVYYIISTGK